MAHSTMTGGEKKDLREPVVPSSTGASQEFGHSVRAALALDAKAAAESVENLNQLLADTIVLRDLYKKHHWQVSGPTFYSLHTLYDKHAAIQSKLVDLLAERVQSLGGMAIAMGVDAAEITLIPRAPKDREDPASQLTRLLHAHEVILREARAMARATAASGDAGTNDIIVSDVIREGELQVWFLAQHVQ